MRYHTLILATLLTVQPGCATVNQATPVTATGAVPQASQTVPVTSLAYTQTGSIRLVGGTLDGRQIQYISSDIAAARVTVLDASNNAVVAQVTFTGATLLSHLNTTTRVFSFNVDNLPIASSARPAGFSYLARVEVFLDTGLATGIGSSTSSAFSVNSSQVTTVQMPALTLSATPLGSATASLSITDSPAPAVVIR
jgi:hypothetical protein